MPCAIKTIIGLKGKYFKTRLNDFKYLEILSVKIHYLSLKSKEIYKNIIIKY